MHLQQTPPTLPAPWRLAALFWLCAGNVLAEPAAENIASLPAAYAAAWARQPEALAGDRRREAAAARRQAAERWLAEPAAIEMSGKTDQITGNEGSREYEVGIALPLWLPGERNRAAALAEAEHRAELSRASAARLRTAADVRAAWWNWQRARDERRLAGARLDNARQLAADVARRVQAGDLARADRHQADGALASAELALAEAEAVSTEARQQLRALTGHLPLISAADPEPTPGDNDLDPAHPALAVWRDRADSARRSAELASVQTRANPELTVAATRGRGAAGERWEKTLTFGVRIPFGSAPQHRARSGLAHAEAIEAEGQARLEQDYLIAALDNARSRVEATRTQLAAAGKRARLAVEARGFFEKSFRLGETDLPTRLRIELEAVEAERQAARIRIDHAAAISALRQALGLLPE